MKTMRLCLTKLFGSVTLPMALIACVTINIYFPAAAAEKAAASGVRAPAS